MNRSASLLLAAAVLLSVSTAAAQLVVRPNVAPVVRSQIADASQYAGTTHVLDLSAAFRDPDASAAVRLTTSLGVMNFTLDGETAPITVANFLRYVDEGRYFIHDATADRQASLFFHRSVPSFVIQSGGFMGTVNPNGSGNLLPSQVPAFDTIQNEPVISNRRGTIAMAKIAEQRDSNGNVIPGTGEHSATSQWFINLDNNSANLDFQNGGFSVFGRVAGNGMTVADAIAALPVRNFGSPFDQLPVRNYTAPNPARVENIVSIPELTRISPFTFAATSSNPAVANVVVSGTNLLIEAREIGGVQINVTATDLDGAAVSQSFNVNIVAGPGRLRNISTRGRIPQSDVMIAGFILRGGPSHRVVVRAIGPSLTDAGVADALADTTIELHSATQLLASNDDWRSGSDAQLIEDIGLAPDNDKEAAIMATLPASADAFTAYTAIIRSKDGTSGIGLVEVFELESGPGSTIRNLATRSRVALNEPLIGGLILQGTDSRRLVVRAIGPSLPPEVGTRLPNPRLQLINAFGQVVDENDDWQTHPNAGEIQGLDLAPGNPDESALITTQPSGGYTAVITGSNDAPSGVALVEVFQVQ